MSRATAIICGLLLFGLGLFLGMIGSFVGTLAPETPQAPRSEARAKPVANQPQRAARPKLPAATQPPPAVESALSQALAMVAVALASQPATSVPSAAATPTAAPADTVTNAPEQHPLDLLMPATASETARVEPPAAVPSPPPQPSPPDPLAGHWVFDQRLGWLWLPEGSPSVVVVPVIEVFPGGLITIHAGPKANASKTPPSRQRKGSVIQRAAPDSKQPPTPPPFQRKQ